MSATKWALWVFLLLAFFAKSRAADDKTPGPPWSAPVHGLRARIFTMPSTEPMIDKTFDVWIELQEVGLDTSLGFQHRSLTVRFSRPELQVAIGSKAGKVITPTTREGNAPVFTWDLVFPPGGDISFPMGTGGSHPHVILGRTPPKGRLLTFDEMTEWIVPTEGGPYQLAITFSVENPGGEAASTVNPDEATPAPSTAPTAGGTNASPGSGAAQDSPGATAATDTAFAHEDADAAHKTAYRGWTGTLVLPAIDIPQPQQ